MEADLHSSGEIDWDGLLLEHNFPGFADILENSAGSETESLTQAPQPLPIPSPDDDNTAVSSWIGEIEKVLMEDDHLDDKLHPLPISDDFFADILVDSPLSGSGEVIDDAAATDAAAAGAVADAAALQEQNNAHTNIDDDGDDDPLAKKRRRQLRNKDAAVRSRERKKIYVKDLEMKSRYLEGECRRLGRMLQCFIAENQTLRFALNKGCAFDASSTKQESAVLLLESLLLGSLLWFLGIMCLFTLPILPKSLLEAAVPLENVEKRSPEKVAPRGAGSNLVGLSFVKTRRCKASRTRMKDLHVFGILARNCSSFLNLVVSI